MPWFAMARAGLYLVLIAAVVLAHLALGDVWPR